MPKFLPIVLCAALVSTAAAQKLQWIDVPFVSQPAEGCGAASIAMVMQYWTQQNSHPVRSSPFQTGHSEEQKVDVAQIQRELYSKPAHGIYASDLQQYLESHGFTTYIVHGDIP